MISVSWAEINPIVLEKYETKQQYKQEHKAIELLSLYEQWYTRRKLPIICFAFVI